VVYFFFSISSLLDRFDNDCHFFILCSCHCTIADNGITCKFQRTPNKQTIKLRAAIGMVCCASIESSTRPLNSQDPLAIGEFKVGFLKSP